MQKIPDNIDSKFRFIMLAAKRAKQLQNNAKPKIATGRHKPARIAIQEVLAGSIEFEILTDPKEQAS